MGYKQIVFTNNLSVKLLSDGLLSHESEKRYLHTNKSKVKSEKGIYG